jgi:hypothetical protein
MYNVYPGYQAIAHKKIKKRVHSQTLASGILMNYRGKTRYRIGGSLARSVHSILLDSLLNQTNTECSFLPEQQQHKWIKKNKE